MTHSRPAEDGNGSFLIPPGTVTHVEVSQGSSRAALTSLLAALPPSAQLVITFLLYFSLLRLSPRVQSRRPPKNHHNNRGPRGRLAARLRCAPSPTLTSVFSPACGPAFSPSSHFPVSPPAHDSLALDEFRMICLFCLRTDSPNKAVMCIFIINHLRKSDVFSVFILLVCLGIVVFCVFILWNERLVPVFAIYTTTALEKARRPLQSYQFLWFCYLYQCVK